MLDVVHVDHGSGASKRFYYCLTKGLIMLKILAFQLRAYCETFSESILCLIFYLVFNCNNSKIKQEK